MGKIKEFFKKQIPHRRSFLKIAGLSSLGIGAGLSSSTQWGNAAIQPPEGTYRDHRNIWRRDENNNLYFIPKNLRTDMIDQGTVFAKVDGCWRSYQLREFDDIFHEWWIAEKSLYYDRLIAFFSGESEELNIPNGGHHHPMLATYGVNWSGRGDSVFHLNCTPKGLTIIPKADKIDYVNQQIDAVYNDPNASIPVDIFKKRKEMYQQRDLWDKTRFATLELYTGRPIDSDDPGGGYGFRETHTFSNVMDNPASTLTYMALYTTDGTEPWFNFQADETPTFEFRGFSWMISYYNPQNSDYEKKIGDYINQAHCRYHGGSCTIATNVFLIVEEFNNSPGFDPYGRGKRVVPPFQYAGSSTKNAAAGGRKMTKADKIELIKKLRIPV